MTTAKVVTDMISQSAIPSRSGRTPTFLSEATVSPLPIRNNVIQRTLCEIYTIPFVSGSGVGRNVLTTIAPMNINMNHGIEILRPLLLKTKVETIARGIIQSALVSFTVVATFSASSPNAAPAPTTELVSCIAIAAQIPN